MTWIVTGLFLALWIVYCWVGASWGDRWLWRRPSHSGLWRAAFLPAKRERADEMLEWICDAFALRRTHRFKLRPSDRLWEVYRHYYPPGSWGDNMEMEDLWDSLEGAGVDPLILERDDVTVRDLVVAHAGAPLGGR